MAENSVTIDYTVENRITQDDFQVDIKVTLPTPNQPFINFMEKAAREDQRFRFESETFGEMGKMITKINGLAQNKDENKYWYFLKRNGAEDRMLEVGVSSYIPTDGEHIVMAYKTMGQMPPCPEGGGQ